MFGECDGVSSPSGQLCLLNHSTHMFTLLPIALAGAEEDKIRFELQRVRTDIQTHKTQFKDDWLHHALMILCMNPEQKG